MKTLRRWLLNPERPFSLPLAADARLSFTDYLDDQVWELHLGTSDSPALALQTHYGGRVGLASLIPMWLHEGRVIYQTSGYAHAPQITAFAPGYLRVQASLTLQLALQAEYWAMESHAVGARFTLSNAHTAAASVRLDLFAHLAARGKEQPVRMLALPDQTHALHFERSGNLNPIIVLEGGSAELDPRQPLISPKIGRSFTIGGRKKIEVRWVHAALPDTQASLALAQQWLGQNWDDYFKRIVQGASTIPDIETGDEDLDLTIANAYQQLVLAFIQPTSALPHTTFVAERSPNTGFNPDGEYRRSWSGQAPPAAYLAGLGIAAVSPLLAHGIVRNYLAVQRDDGWIDWKPGPAGQKQDTLCLPILARMAWGIFQYTEDEGFLAEVFPGLLRFFQRWLQPDLDADNDGLPEWQNEHQTGYPFWPAFALSQSWAHNTDIRLVETPDLASYLLSEAMSLRAIAHYFHKADLENTLSAQIDRLRNSLEALWRGSRYCYRDRDTHHTAPSSKLLQNGHGDEEHFLAHTFAMPSRVTVYIEGGIDHRPTFAMILAGLDPEGHAVEDQVPSTDFFWHRNHGAYTTTRIYRQIDRLRLTGLSRVYSVEAYTPDTSTLDLNALLPIWSASLEPARAAAVVQLLTDPQHFWRANGVTMCSAQDAHFDPSNASGSGGVWPYWLTLIGEGLIEAGRQDLAAALIKRLMSLQKQILKTEHSFTEFYHSDEPSGLGERGHLAGIIPLHLFLRVVGVRIISTGKVWTGGSFFWEQPITIRQHGVTVSRSAQGTQIEFPSGYQAALAGDAEWQAVIDPKPAPMPALRPGTLRKPSKRSRNRNS